MKARGLRITLVLLILFVLLAASSTSGAQAPVSVSPPQQESAAFSLQVAPPWQGEPEEEIHATGYEPPDMDLSHLTGQRSLLNALSPQVLPSTFDWRDVGGQNYVTSVKDQGTCGCCYAFAGLGNVESRLRIDGAGTYDLSENHAKECNWYELNNIDGGTSCSGGNYMKVTNLWSKKGTVLEADDPFSPIDGACQAAGGPFRQTLLDWRIISGAGVMADTSVLKQYIHTYGPVFTSMYVWGSEFNDYDGSYTLYYSGTGNPNHAVVIVGWDDTRTHAGGSGAWIAKNSWGTDWGDDGYFYIAYGSASMGMDTSFAYDWQDYDPYGAVWSYDEGGWSGGWGVGSTTGWGQAVFTSTLSTYATRVEFWTTSASTTADVYVYDDPALTHRLAEVTGNSFNEAGYHSVPLPELISLDAGDDVFVVVKFTNSAGYVYPVPVDLKGPVDGTTYVSSDGSSWHPATYDVAIRLRTSADPGPSVSITKRVIGSHFEPGDPITFTLTLESNGSDVATSPVVTDAVPSQILTPTFVSTLEVTATGAISYVWDVEPLEAGEMGVITITGQIDPGWDGETPFSNEAILWDPEDITPANNSSRVFVANYRVYLPLMVREWSSAGWITILSEDFGGSFPGSWTLTGNGGYTWGKRDCRSYQGSYSGWAVGGGANGDALSCGSSYPNNADSMMRYGPFSLADATDGDLSFQLWLNSEPDYDYLCRYASVDGASFYGYCTHGNSSGWMERTLDLKDVPTLGNLMGQSQVWIAIRFLSDESYNYLEGAYVDNIVLRKYVSSTSGMGPAADLPEPASGAEEIEDVPAVMILER